MSCLFTTVSFSFPPLLPKPCRFSPLYSTAADGVEDSYVPMRPSTSPSAPGSDCSPDGYIPMSPSSATFTFPVVSTEKLTSPLPELPSDLEPPPVNRDLKPRRKCKARPKERLGCRWPWRVLRLFPSLEGAESLCRSLEDCGVAGRIQGAVCKQRKSVCVSVATSAATSAWGKGVDPLCSKTGG